MRSPGTKSAPRVGPDPAALLTAVFEASDDAIVGIGLDGTIQTWGGGAARVYGYAEDEVVGTPVLLLAAPSQRDELAGILARVVAGDRAAPLQTVGVTRSGRRIDVLLHMVPVRGEAGEIQGVLAVAHETSGERVVARALRQQQALLDEVFRAAPEGILGVENSGRIAFVNPAGERMFGYEPGALRGASLEDLVPEGDRETHLRRRAEFSRRPRVRHTGAGMHLRGRRKDGSTFPADIVLAPLSTPGGRITLAMVRDLSEYERLDRRLVQAEASYRALVEQIPAIIYTNDAPYEACRYVSPQFGRLLGVDPEGRLDDPGFFDGLVHPDDRALLRDVTRRAVASGRPLSCEYRMIARDGREIWFHDQARLIRDAKGTPLFWQGVMLDITDRKHAELALARAHEEVGRSEQRLQALTENVSDAILVVGPDGTPRFETGGVARILGYAARDLADPFDWVHEKDRKRAAQLLENLVRGPGRTAHVEIRVLDAAGELRWVELTAKQMLDDPAVGGIVVNFHDVTQRKEAEADLRRTAEQMAALSSERQALLAELISAEEAERARIAVDVHDDPIQQISALVMRLDLLGHHHPELTADENFAQLTAVAQDAIRSLRFLMFELRPTALDHEGIAAALAAHLRELRHMPDAPEYVLVNRLTDEPPIETRVVLYRIAHEALSNVRRHAHAGRVEVTLEWRDGLCCIEVRDDGIGFVPGGGDSPVGHLGLSAMRERAQIAGGFYRLESSPGSGTSVTAGIPPLAGAGDPSAGRP